MANLVRFSRVTGIVAVLLLRNASVGAVEGLGDIRQHIIGLKLTVSRRVGCKIKVGDVLEQRIVPTTASKITEQLCTCDRSRMAYLLTMRALTTIGSPLIAPLAIRAFCSSKYVTKLGP